MFTKEWIAEQRTLAVALPKGLSVGDIHKNHVNINQNFDSKPIPTKLNIADVNIFSTMPETCLIAQSICDACNNYPEALDEISRLQARVQELEHYKRLNEEWVHEKVEGLTTLEEIEKMVKLSDRLQREQAVNKIICGWCDAKFYTKEQITKHLLKCNDNPLVKQIKELELRLAEKDGE